MGVTTMFLIGRGPANARVEGTALTPIPSSRVCGPDGVTTAAGALAQDSQAVAAPRLSDYMLSTSPLEGYQAAYDGPVPVDAGSLMGSQQTYLSAGVVDVYARTFNSPSHAGGFTNYAFRFASHDAAIAAAAGAYVDDVCRLGGDAMGVTGEPGVVVSVPVAAGANTAAWWVRGETVLELHYAMYGARKTDLANAGIVLDASLDLPGA
jgi:hypothetical protein